VELRRTMVLTARARSARAESSFTISAAAGLCGSVTFAPPPPSTKKLITAWRKPAGATSWTL
jgi:hypothetical protein